MMPLNGTKRHRARACTQRGARAGMCLPALLYAFAVYLIEADGCTYVLYVSGEGAVLGPYRGVPEQEVSVRNHFVLEYGSKRYELTKKSVRGGAYVLLGDGGSPIGSVRGKRFFKREWTVDLPEELPLEVEMFIMWLIMGVVIMGGVPMNSREGWTIGIGAAIGVVIGGGFGSIVFGVGLVGLLAGVAGGTIGMALGTSLADHRRR